VKQAIMWLALVACSASPPDHTEASEVCQVLVRSTAFEVRVVGYEGLMAQCCEREVRASCTEVQRTLREHGDPAAVEGFMNTRWRLGCKHGDGISGDDVRAFLMDDRMAPWESVRERIRKYIVGPHELGEPEVLLREASRPNPAGWEALADELATLSDRDLRRLAPMLSDKDPVVRALAATAFSKAARSMPLELGESEAALARLAREAPGTEVTGAAATARKESRRALFSQGERAPSTPNQAVTLLKPNWVLLGRREVTCGATNLNPVLYSLRKQFHYKTLDNPVATRVLEEWEELCSDKSLRPPERVPITEPRSLEPIRTATLDAGVGALESERMVRRALEAAALELDLVPSGAPASTVERAAERVTGYLEHALAFAAPGSKRAVVVAADRVEIAVAELDLRAQTTANNNSGTLPSLVPALQVRRRELRSRLGLGANPQGTGKRPTSGDPSALARESLPLVLKAALAAASRLDESLDASTKASRDSIAELGTPSVLGLVSHVRLLLEGVPETKRAAFADEVVAIATRVLRIDYWIRTRSDNGSMRYLFDPVPPILDESLRFVGQPVTDEMPSPALSMRAERER
jgi:hypothetical protein